MTALPASTAARPTPPRPAARAAWIGGSMPMARLGVIVNLAVPLAVLAWDAAHRQLGVDPVNFAIHTTGRLAVLCLLLSLLATPLRQVTGWNWLVQFRRAIGVWAFYYACCHLAIYFWWEQGHDLRRTASEIVHRFYLTIGFASLALMAPLWATSFNRAIRAIGGTGWKRLHRLAYVATVLACWHYWLQSKSYKFRPDLAIAVLGGLMLWRAVAAGVRWARRPAGASVAAGGLPLDLPGGKARSWKGELKVIGTVRETDAVRTFRLAPADGGPIPFAFKAGQFLNLSVNIDGKKFGRSYTIASPPTRDRHVELTIKREENGTVSRFLHERLMTGGTVAVSAPAGRFTFDPDRGDAAERGILLIAGGVGVTPVMSILRDLTDRRWPGKIDLVFSVRTPADTIFADELRLIAARHPNVGVHVTVTRDPPADWAGPTGRVTAELLKRLVPDVAARRAFVCGPDEMAAAVREQLIAAGTPADRITLESFTPAAVPPGSVNAPPADGSAAVTVTFERSGRTAQLSGGTTILDGAESVGVTIDSQCRSGICGTCRCKLVDGTVTMAVRDALSDADEADGYILACQAVATSDVTVDA